jgi:hypothetical protein
MVASSRTVYVALALVVVAIGLATRIPILAFPFAKYAGSIIWGGMVYFVLAALWPAQRAAFRAVVAGCFAACVEFSQLWHPTWLDEFRRTTLGVLLLGRFFSW